MLSLSVLSQVSQPEDSEQTLEEQLGPDLWVNLFYLLSFTYYHVQGIKTTFFNQYISYGQQLLKSKKLAWSMVLATRPSGCLFGHPNP